MPGSCALKRKLLRLGLRPEEQSCSRGQFSTRHFYYCIVRSYEEKARELTISCSDQCLKVVPVPGHGNQIFAWASAPILNGALQVTFEFLALVLILQSDISEKVLWYCGIHTSAIQIQNTYKLRLKRFDNALKTRSKPVQNAFNTRSKRVQNAFITRLKGVQNAYKTRSKQRLNRVQEAYKTRSKRVHNAFNTRS